MKIIYIIPGSRNNPLTFNKKENTFYGSEKNIPFDTSYEVKNTETGISVKFNFTHSTGPEFDPKTQWVYKSEQGMLLIVANDAEITRINADNFLKAKTGKS